MLGFGFGRPQAKHELPMNVTVHWNVEKCKRTQTAKADAWYKNRFVTTSIKGYSIHRDIGFGQVCKKLEALLPPSRVGTNANS